MVDGFMKLLRSVFVTAYISFVVALAIYAAVQLLRGMQPWPAWLGLFICASAPAFFFARILISPAPRTARHPMEISIVCALGLVITMVYNWRYEEAAGAVHLWSGACLIGWMIYLRWYSVFSERNSAKLLEGQVLPDFQLESADGQEVSSAQFSGQPHVLVFFRGNWCPFCTAQITELAGQYRELEQMGVEIVLISSQPQSHNQNLAEKFAVPMTFLRDPDNNAARELGILAPWGTPMGLQLLGYSSETALPTVILTDGQGRILWSHQTDNYRIRPEPDTFIKVLKEKGLATPQSP
jgi:peroxiredoxin